VVVGDDVLEECVVDDLFFTEPVNEADGRDVGVHAKLLFKMSTECSVVLVVTCTLWNLFHFLIFQSHFLGIFYVYTSEGVKGNPKYTKKCLQKLKLYVA